MKRIIAILAAILAAISCEDKVNLPESSPQIVVEGWIEDGGNPVVIVTTSVPVNETLTDLSELQNHVVNWAKVTVSDGEEEIVLTGQRNDNYFPPYIYTTVFMTGKAGRKYDLKVEYSNRTVTASTTIPAPKSLEYIKVTKASVKDSMYSIVGGLKDDPQTKDYYKVFTKVRDKDKAYVSSFLGLTDDEILDEAIREIPINNGTGIVGENLEAFFTAGDFVSVRFCTLDKESWTYWNDFEEVQSLASNMLFPISTDIRSNIKGGLGYWAGYGSSYYKVSIPDSLKLGRVY